MADLQHRTSRKMANGNGFSSKNIYDDVFGGPPKFTAPSFGIEIDDYGEIFGFFSSSGSNGCSSVPVLDFPVDDGWGEDGEVSGGSLSSKFAYSDIFGGLDWGDFAVSYEDLFGSKKQGGSASILSKNTWTPAEAKSWQQSPAVVSSVCMEEPEGDLIARMVRVPFLSHVVSDPLYTGLDQTNMSFQNPNKKTKEDASNGTRHTGQLARAISEFTCGVDVLSASQKCEIYPTVPQIIGDTPNVSSNGEILEEKIISKSTPPNPVDNNFLKTSPGCKITVLEEVPSNACDHRHSHDSDNDLRHGGEVFITVSEVNLRTEPSRVPPPARPPPQLVTKGGVSERLMAGKVKVYADKEDFHNQFGGSFKTPVVEEVASQSSPPFFDVEVDASSAAAAASAAAMKEAMERAEARLKSAKYSMEKKRDIKGRENGATKGREIMGHAIGHENLINKEEAAREVCKEEDRGTEDNLRVERQRNAKTVPDFEDRERQLQFAQESREREFGKILGDTQEAHEPRKKSGEWKSGKNFYEWEDHEKKFKAARDVFEQGQKEKKLSSAKEDCKHDKNEKKLKEHKEAHDREEIEKKLKAAKETYNREENEKKLKAAQAALVREENEKKQKVAQEAHEREENERKLKLTQEQEENERKLKLVREAHEWEENERKRKLAQEVQERKENERTLKLAQKARQREENERKLKLVQEAHEREENERKLKLAQEAREREENEKKLKLTQEAHMREENERKLKLAQEFREREEDERKLKVTQEARKQEEAEKKLKSSQEAREREENERKLKLAQEYHEWEENERRLKLAQEACEMEENERKLKLSQEALEHEENTWKLKLAEEACKQEENQRELKLAQETCEPKENERELKLAQEICEPKDNECKLKSFEEVREREANGRKLKMSHQDCSWKENEKELITDLHVNVRDGKKKILNKSEESHEIEETESKMRNIDIENNKRELTETVRVQREREQEKERLRKIEEEKEREREREKDRIAVERATREARERAFEEVRERASAEARGKAERASMEARLKTERAAVERATTEARERAIERALAEKASQEARERVERSVAEKFAATCRQRKDNDLEEFIRAGAKADDGMKQSPTYTEFEYDLQFQSTVSSSGTFQRYSDASDYGDTSNYGFHSVEKFQEAEGESAKRCKAKLERQQRTDERVAKALAEKKLRDILALREQAERNRLAETLDADIRRWSMGKEGNLRALLSTLQYILWPESGWQSIPLTEVITAAAVKKAYRKATLCVHPDKVQQRGASIQQKYISEKVFDLLKEAWNRFNSEER